MMKLSSLLASLVLTVMIALVAAHAGQKPGPGNEDHDPEVGKSYRVPYRMTETNHFLVRVRIHGKGPLNFLVDTGASSLLHRDRAGGEEDRPQARARVSSSRRDRPPRIRRRGQPDRDEGEGRGLIFQMVGMNALGLPGASIDGILGFTVLARFKVEIDPTQDRMTWTRLD